jgi:general secretion pathway protein D
MIALKKRCSSLIFLSLFSIAAAITPASTVAAKKTGSRIAHLEFRDITVSDALKVLSQQSNLNIVASQDAAKIHIAMYFQDIQPLDVIDAIAKTYNLWYKYDEQTNIIRIYTVKEYRMEQVEFKQEETQVFTLKNAKNALDLADTISNLYGDRVVLSFGQNQQELMNDLRQRFQRFDLIDSRTRLSTNFGSGNSSSGNNGNQNNSNSNNGNNNNANSSGSNNSGNFNTGSNNNSQRRQNLQPSSVDEGIDNLSQSLKKNNSQENLLAGESRAMDSAIIHQSPIYVSVIKHQNKVLVRTRDKEAMADIKKLYQKLNNESAMMLMEVKILSLDLGDDFNSLFDLKIKSGDTNVRSGQKSLTDIATDTLAAASGAFNPALLATVVSQNFEARLQLLEKENRVTELATPVLMTTNQEVSRVFIGEERPITTGFTGSTTNTTATTTGNNAIINTQIIAETETRSLGTTLLLTPNINADRTVSINVLIEQSGLSPQQATIPVPLGNEFHYADVDVVQAKTFSGTVVAKDNSAIAVGGLISEKASNRENKVPILGDIPGLGFFFREEAQARGRQELVVIIKPHIIATPSEASEVNQQFMEKNSIHPNAEDADSLDVYTNPTGEHKDYHLEKPFKEYPGQDAFDKYHNRDGAQSVHKVSVPVNPDAEATYARQIYVRLTRYAADAVRLPAAERKLDPKIQTATLPQQFMQVDLLYDPRIKALPVASWHQGGIYVTALELHNTTDESVKVDYQHLKGRWLAATIENDTLKRQNSAGKSHITHLYLVSSQPFDEIVKTAP